MPFISVDTKKKELFGNFKNAGQEWRPAGAPNDVAANDGFVNVGTNRDTPVLVDVHDFPSDAVGQGDPVRCLLP